ncbi:MAG: copper chaperone PCu(A)C [Methylocystaceae bacterium]|nr:copper chaperone PCu(A)C [Methylocystaceae bacterium]
MFKRLVLCCAMVVGLATPSFAGDLVVEDVWARASAGMARAGAAFMTIKNSGEADKLIAAKADVSKKVELHTHIHENGIMKMRQVDHIMAAKGMTMLEPGSYHVMFMGLNAPLEEGKSFPLTLVFEKAGEINVTVDIKSPGAMGKMKKMNHGQGQGHGKMKME